MEMRGRLQVVGHLGLVDLDSTSHSSPRSCADTPRRAAVSRQPSSVAGVRVASFGLQQARLVLRMGVGLVAGHKSGAHDDGHGASNEHGTRGSGIADPARRKHWQRHGPSHLGQ